MTQQGGGTTGDIEELDCGVEGGGATGDTPPAGGNRRGAQVAAWRAWKRHASEALSYRARTSVRTIASVTCDMRHNWHT